MSSARWLSYFPSSALSQEVKAGPATSRLIRVLGSPEGQSHTCYAVQENISESMLQYMQGLGFRVQEGWVLCQRQCHGMDIRVQGFGGKWAQMRHGLRCGTPYAPRHAHNSKVQVTIHYGMKPKGLGDMSNTEPNMDIRVQEVGGNGDSRGRPHQRCSLSLHLIMTISSSPQNRRVIELCLRTGCYVKDNAMTWTLGFRVLEANGHR